MRILKVLILASLTVILISCSNNDNTKEVDEQEDMKEALEGFVVQKEEKRFLMVDDDDSEAYDKIKDLSMEKLLQLEPAPPLVYVNYDDMDSLEVGDKLKVDYNGIMTFSIPGQINASKVTIIK